jgi:hypothetical protein
MREHLLVIYQDHEDSLRVAGAALIGLSTAITDIDAGIKLLISTASLFYILLKIRAHYKDRKNANEKQDSNNN